LASTRKLSSDEVNALIEGLSEDSGEAAVSPAEDKDVRPFQFGSDDLSLLGDYYALRMINERFARMARQVFLPMLRIQPRISSFPPEVKTFDEYTAGIENFMSLNISRIEELRGSMLAVLSPTFISVLTNSYYGGKIKPLATTRSEFTATEERIIEIISSGLNDTLEVAWRDLMEINIQNSSREVNPQFASFVDGNDLVIICSFVVQLPDIDAASFDIIYPLQTLKPIASLLRSRVQSDKANDDKSWRDRMERAVLEIPLNLTARLSEPTVSMNKLIRLREGDVFPIDIGEGVEILIEKLPFYNGELGEVGGQAAISLTERRTE
jgi:flagellar motor switch protein FliM